MHAMHTCTDVLLGDELMQVVFEAMPLPGSLGEGDPEVSPTSFGHVTTEQELFCLRLLFYLLFRTLSTQGKCAYRCLLQRSPVWA